jgi:hypothetical protein
MTVARGTPPSIRKNGPAANGRSLFPTFEVDPDDMEYNPSESYPEVAIGRGLTVQLAWLTPEVAAEYLALDNGKIQRYLKPLALAAMIKDHLAGLWMLTGEPVIFDRDGFLIDGQHRCHVVVDAGKPMLTLIVRGVNPDAYKALNSGTKRSVADAIRATGADYSRGVAAAVSLFERYSNRALRGMGNYSRVMMTPVSSLSILDQHPGLGEVDGDTWSVGRIAHSSGVAIFCRYILGEVSTPDARLFFRRLASGEDLAKDHPILTLRNKFQKERFDVDTAIFLIFTAWNSFRKRRNLSRFPTATASNMPTPI